MTKVATKATREYNYDCLRVYAMFMVILNHIVDRFVFTTQESSFYEAVYLCEGISHCAVPVFLMLTGAFLIDQLKHVSPKEFYIKSFRKIGIPTISFVVIYWIYDYVEKNKDLEEILETLIEGCHGAYAHWYVFMLVGIYAVLPLVALIKQHVKPNSYKKMVCLYFVWGIASRWFEASEVSWSVGAVFSFLGYVLLGDVLKEELDLKKNNCKAIILYIIGIICLMTSYYNLYQFVLETKQLYNVYLSGYAAPLVVVGSILIFCGFGSANLHFDVTYLSSLSFNIFLNHKLILNILDKSIFKELELLMDGDARFIIVEVVIVFVISVPIAIITNKFFLFIGNKYIKRKKF